MQLGLGLGLTRIGGGSSLAQLLFSANEPGFTFEPWDITTLYQDRAGTTPVTAAGQSVGYRRDKSGRGNHQVAVSDAKRGVYGWMPKTGRRNLLTYTEQFDNAVWVKGELTVSTDAAVAPDGTTTADKLVESVNNAGRGTYYNPTSSTAVALSQNVTFTTYLKAAERGFGGMTAVDGGNNRYYLVANLSTGAEIASGFANGSTTVVSKSITNVGGGWYRLQVTLTSGGAGNAFMWGYPQDDATFSTSTTGNAIYQGNGTSGIYIWGAQLEVGSTATAYQRVASQYDITEAGVPTCYYVQADGVDDAYVTPTITPNTDKAQVFAGVRKLSDAAAALFLEYSANVNSNNGAFVVGPGNFTTATGPNYHASSKGTVISPLNTPASYASPITNVVSALLDISGDSNAIRVNGAQVAQSTADQGTGNFLAYPAYIYGRAGTLFPFNGYDFGHAVRFGPNLDAATIARVEALIARNTPEVTL